MQAKLFLLAIFISSIKINAQSSFVQLSNGIDLKANNCNLKVEACTDKIIHVLRIPNNSKASKSLVVNANWNLVKPNISSTNNQIVIATKTLKCKIDIKSGNVSFYDLKDSLILSEDEKKISEIKEVVLQNEKTYNIKQHFSISEEEGLYGLGQFQEGVMNWHNKKARLIQENKRVAIPVLISTKNYGIVWDNCSHTEFESTTTTMNFWSEAADAIDYYFIYGQNVDEVISGYRTATGKAPMLPKWAFGYWQSKERYQTQKEVLSIAQEYRKRNLPIDVIVQDWQYWGKYGWSAMQWDESTFPHPKNMMDSLHNVYNVKLLVSNWPTLIESSPVAKELEAKGYLFKQKSWNNGRVYDAYNQEARSIYWKHLKKGEFDLGVDGWWLDATEPEMISDLTEFGSKKSIINLGKNSAGTFTKYLNPYPFMTSLGVYENQRISGNQKRVVILTRSGFTAQQRTGAITWSGDVVATYEVFKNQISGGLNYSYTGNPNWTTDIGAFFPGANGGDYPLGVKDSAYCELYTRWFQFGVFCPIFRSHGTETPREIWQFGEKGSQFYNALEKFDNLRYRLLPYIYSLAWRVHENDYTYMRGLAMDFSNDKKVYNINDEFMYGNAFLVRPVTEEIYYTAYKPGKPIPRTQLFNVDGITNGLKAEYFKGMNFEKLIATQNDLEVNNEWAASPTKEMPQDAFSIRFTGKIKASETGQFEIATMSDDGLRLWIDNKLVIDNWTDHSPKMDTVLQLFEKNKFYDIKLEYFENSGDATIKLLWKTPAALDSAKNAKRETAINSYLPDQTEWYDFWTGEKMAGGQSIKKEVPMDIMPLYVRAGSIIPMGPFIQYATEKNINPIELRIYTGANGNFTLYEDENDNYNYEKGIYSTIDFKWDESNKELTIGKRNGEFPGMLKTRTFNIILINKNKGIGEKVDVKPDKMVMYDGQELKLKMNQEK